MRKIFTIILVLLVVIILGFVAFATDVNKNEIVPVAVKSGDPKNTSYIIEGREVFLEDGKSTVEALPGSATKITTEYFGNEVKRDFNKDGREDVAFLITQNTGGSGTFYYVVVALNTREGYVGSEGFLLGDRIAPQTTEIGEENTILVNYADRKPNESFATMPSVGKSIWLKLDTETLELREVIKNTDKKIEVKKETVISTSTNIDLAGRTWTWVKTIYNDGKVVMPNIVNRFTITFKADNTFGATTDCNGVGGEYKYNAITGEIFFERMMSTLMYCEGSQESVFSQALGEVESVNLSSNNELVFTLKSKVGKMYFK